MSEILFMIPVFKQMIWGGNKLGSKWGYEIPGENTGECWAVSAHPNGDCTVKEGAFAGKTLSQLWTEPWDTELSITIQSGKPSLSK